MKLGFLTAILEELTLDEIIDFASEVGYEAIEVACWPTGKSIRRYGGVTHINVNNLTDEDVRHIKEKCEQKNIEISALGYYPNHMDQNLKNRKFYNDHLLKVIDAADRLNVSLVNTFIGRMTDKNLEDNLAIVNEVWDPILEYACNKGIKIGIENCPMLFTYDEWPGGQNLASSPHNIRLIFENLSNENIGINFDPSHHIIQDMEYEKFFHKFKDRIFHLHLKDMKIDIDKLNEYGRLAPPNFYTIPKIPGHGDINWSKFFSSATEIGYDGYAVVEIEDRSYERNLESRKNALEISYRYAKNFL